MPNSSETVAANPKSVQKVRSSFTDHGMVNNRIRRQQAINTLKRQSVLNKNVKNNYFKAPLPKPKRRNHVPDMDGPPSLYKLVLNDQLDLQSEYRTYSIDRLDYYILVREMHDLKRVRKSIFEEGRPGSILTYQLFDHVVSYYKSAIKYSRLPTVSSGDGRGDSNGGISAVNEIVSGLIQFELKEHLENSIRPHGVLKPTEARLMRIDEHIAFTTFPDELAAVIPLEADESCECVLSNLNDLQKNALALKPNGLVIVPKNHQVTFKGRLLFLYLTYKT